jgi:oligopeptidase A
MTITQTQYPYKLTLPSFEFDLKELIPQLHQILNQYRKAIDRIATQSDAPTWANTMAPLEAQEDALHQFYSPLSHLHGVQNSDEVRAVYDESIAPLSQFESEIAHHTALYNRVLALAHSDAYAELSSPQKKAIDNALRSFRLSGVHLPSDKKKEVADCLEALAQKSTDFSNHILDATQAWFYQTDDENQLNGLPDHMKALAQEVAQSKALTGFVLTLDAPTYIAAMTYLKNRALREKLYEAYTTRASDQGPHAGQFDNSTLMVDIVRLRKKLAQLLGFKDFASYNLETKMAKSSEEVIAFLENLLSKAKPKAQKELETLVAFAYETDGIKDLKPWDMAYYSELLQQKLFSISDEQLRPYFECNQVLKGLFSIAKQLYNISITPFEEPYKTWHKDVRTFAITNERQELQALFIIDLFARELKRSGAWMDEAIARRQLSPHQHQVPIAYLTCNFAPPAKDQPSLLTHEEVITLFHEFGHCLQHMLTTIEAMDVAGIAGVPWDAVELPSQFMENWAWESDALNIFAKHFQTGELLPKAWLKNMKASQQFQGALSLCRQLQFALFDMKAHQADLNIDEPNALNDLLDRVRQETSVMPIPSYNRFAHSFSHIFAGGYAAGYYSYLWAELMAADAFEAFEHDGLFHPEHAKAFKKHILEAGGSVDADEAYRRFRGRDPKIDGLLKSYGI